MLTLGRQAPRATEILSLEWCNGQSTERGVYVHDGFVIYVIRHHKAKRSTNNEFTVVRFLHAKVGKLLYYYLVYIQPFAAMLQRETTGSKVLSSLLFGSPHAPQRPWPSNCLADVLVKSSAEVFKKAINIRLYRQLSISITEKHVKKLAKPFNRYDDQSGNADRSVVFAWQSGHRPRQRGTTYGLDGAFPSKMQPALLNIYEWASVEWHQYLGHKSRNTASMGAHQQQPASTVGKSNAVGKSKILNREENPGVASHTSWRVTNRQPKVLEPSHPIKYGFLSLVSQTNFVGSAASSIRDVEEQALTSIAVNRVQSGGVKGQKRLYKTVSPDEDGGNVPRKGQQGRNRLLSRVTTKSTYKHKHLLWLVKSNHRARSSIVKESIPQHHIIVIVIMMVMVMAIINIGMTSKRRERDLDQTSLGPNL